MPLMKKGFTLLELMVVIAIGAILLLVTADFLIFAIQRNNQITIESNVRNEANLLMDGLARDIRNSSCECATANSISLFNSSGCSSYCSGGGSPYAVYTIDASKHLLRNSIILSSNAVKLEICSTCDCLAGPPTPGLIIATPAPSSRSYLVTMSLRQAADNPRSDFCGKVQIQQTIKPRNY